MHKNVHHSKNGIFEFLIECNKRFLMFSEPQMKTSAKEISILLCSIITFIALDFDKLCDAYTVLGQYEKLPKSS